MYKCTSVTATVPDSVEMHLLQQHVCTTESGHPRRQGLHQPSRHVKLSSSLSPPHTSPEEYQTALKPPGAFSELLLACLRGNSTSFLASRRYFCRGEDMGLQWVGMRGGRGHSCEYVNGRSSLQLPEYHDESYRCPATSFEGSPLP